VRTICGLGKGVSFHDFLRMSFTDGPTMKCQSEVEKSLLHICSLKKENVFDTETRA